MKRDPNDEITEEFVEWLEEEVPKWVSLQNKPKRTSTIWVSQLTYRWAKDRWPGRKVVIDSYIADNMIRITKPGFLYYPQYNKRTIRIDDETFQRETERAHTTATNPRPVPKRGS